MLTYFVKTGATIERYGDEVTGEVADTALRYCEEKCVPDDGKYVED